MNLDNWSCPHCWFWNWFRNQSFSFTNWLFGFRRLRSFEMNSLNIWRYHIVWILSINRSLWSNRFYSINLLSHWSWCFWVWVLLLWAIICIWNLRISFDSNLLLYFNSWLRTLASIAIFSFSLVFFFAIYCKITFRIFISCIWIDVSKLNDLLLIIFEIVFELFLLMKSNFRWLIKI